LRNISRKKIIAGVLILGLAALATGLSVVKNKNQAIVPVKTVKAEFQPIQDNVFASGRVRLRAKKEFYTFTGTTVQELNVSPG
jgi:HlyD family secretion protein